MPPSQGGKAATAREVDSPPEDAPGPSNATANPPKRTVGLEPVR
jgi:hypothetical protein